MFTQVVLGLVNMKDFEADFNKDWRLKKEKSLHSAKKSPFNEERCSQFWGEWDLNPGSMVL